MFNITTNMLYYMKSERAVQAFFTAKNAKSAGKKVKKRTFLPPRHKEKQ